MRKIFIIIRREYKENVYKKGFIISTILTPIILLSFIFVPALLSRVEVEEQKIFAVIDHSGIVYDQLNAELDVKLPDSSRKYIFQKVDLMANDRETLKEELKIKVSSTEIDGFIVIPANAVTDSDPISLYARNTGNFDMNRQLRSSINKIITDYRITQSGLEPEVVNKLTHWIDLKTIKITKSSEEKEGGFLKDYLSTFAMVMILYMTIVLYGSSIMRGVIQEKNTRIIEILLSSASSFQLMLGKILGIGAAGLTQYLIWSVFGVMIIKYGNLITGAESPLLSLSPDVFIYFIIFFVLGYFLFATLYASIGALANSDQEAQQMSFPVVFMLIVPLIMMTFLTKNPDSNISIVLSMVPFFSPILMFSRINISTPPFYEILICIILMLVTILIITWIAAKVYRLGILMYGKRPTLPEIMRWIKSK